MELAVVETSQPSLQRNGDGAGLPPQFIEGVRYHLDSRFLGSLNHLDARVYLISSSGNIIWCNEFARSFDVNDLSTIFDDKEFAQYIATEYDTDSSSFRSRTFNEILESAPAGRLPFVFAPLDQSCGGSGSIEAATLIIFNRTMVPRKAETRARPTREEIRKALTPVEWRLVMLLCGGKSLKSAAVEMRVSYNTARKYLQNVFLKVNVRRQVDLILSLQTQ